MLWPHDFGVLVGPGPTYESFDDQLDHPSCSEAKVQIPSRSDLILWSKSCLCLDEFETCCCYGGWSPCRSVAVRTVHRIGFLNFPATYYYKCSDEDCWDVSAKHPLYHGTHADAERWMAVWTDFLKVRGCELRSPPPPTTPTTSYNYD